MDSVAYLWYGVKEETSVEFRTDVEEPENGDWEWVVGGYPIERFYNTDLYIGTGVMVARNWYDEETKIDLAEFQVIKRTVDALFDERGVEGERALRLSAIYS